MFFPSGAGHGEAMLREAAPSRGHPWHAACPGDPPWGATKRGGPIGGVVGPMALFSTFFKKYVYSKWFSTFSNAKKSQAFDFPKCSVFFFLKMTLKITLKRLEMVPGWAMFQRDMSLLLDNALDQEGRSMDWIFFLIFNGKIDGFRLRFSFKPIH